MIVSLVLVMCYAVFLYAILHTRAFRSSDNGAPMFSAIVSELGERRAGMSSKPYASIEDQSTEPPRHWIFPPIDLWPNPPGWIARLSEFTPVREATPDPTQQLGHIPNSKLSVRRSALRMTRWLRPDYPAEWALDGEAGSVFLDLKIDPDGQAAEIIVAKRSGSSPLDDSVARSAHFWRFAPPQWNAHPVEVWARIEVRYHRSSDPE